MSDSSLLSPSNDLSVSNRRSSDWVGAFVFLCIAVWTFWDGWIPVVRDSSIAGILLLPNWLTPVANIVGFLRRKPLVAANPSWIARLTAHVVTFSLPIYFAIFVKQMHIRATGFPYVFAGMAGSAAGFFMLWGAWAMRDSWSIEPQARFLVTTGPFQYARHPLYASYVLRNISALVFYLDFRLAIFVLLWTVLLIYRIGTEERVLLECYPEYQQYRERVSMFSPRLL